MSHVPFQPEGADVEIDADVVVVGTGAGGAAAAVTMARAGLSVVMVEAGAWRDPEQYPADFTGALRDLFDGWQTTMAVGGAVYPVVQARAVGGTTVINSAITVRTPDDVLDLWAREHGLDADHHRAELARHQDAIEAELHVSAVGGPHMGRHNTLTVEGATALHGHDHTMHRTIEGCEGQGRCMVGCRKGHKHSVDRNWIPEVLERDGTLLSCAPVDRVLFDGDRAVGVTGRFEHPRTRARGATFVARARRAVVVAASATHTPLLLKRSGVRHRRLGHGFRAHPGAGALGFYDEVVDMHHGATQGWSSLAWRDRDMKLETLSLPLEMLAARMPGGGTALMQRLARSRHVSHVALGLRAQAVGRVVAGPGGRPLVRYRLTRADLERLREGVHLCARVHVEAGATHVMPGIAGLPPELPATDVDRILTAPLRSTSFLCILSHLFGGATLGTDPARSVCDARGRVRDTRGLVVACAAAIPTTLGVNPQHTIMGLGRMRGEEIAGG